MAQQYSIETEDQSGITVFLLKNAGVASAKVIPEWGNNCFEFRTTHPVFEEVSFDQFSKRPGSYGNPILFPFPNRVKDGRFSFRNRDYQVNPPRHGFIRDKKWKVVDSGSSQDGGAWIRSSIASADYPAEILKQFPFLFYFEVTYLLMGTTLEMITRVKNQGDDELPFGFGIHPYFRMPEKGTLQVPARKYWELVDSLPTGKLLEANGAYNLRDAANVLQLQLDDIYTDLESHGITKCVLTDEKNGTQTIVEFDSRQFPHVVVYTPPTPRRAICIEPYTCPTDVFSLHARGIDTNLLILPPRGEMSFSIRIHG